MNAKQLIEQVSECKKNNWQNSDLGKNSEEMLEAIADHFETCEECRKEFDSQEYPEETLIEFENELNGTELSDWICQPSTKMTMVEALEKLAELNNYDEILIQTNASEPMTIECAIEEVRRNAEDPDEIFDLRVTEDTIREYDENGYFDNNEPLYKVLRNITLYDNLPEELKEFIKSTSFFTVDEYNIVVDDGNERVTIDQIEDQKTYYETGEL